MVIDGGNDLLIIHAKKQFVSCRATTSQAYFFALANFANAEAMALAGAACSCLR